MANRLSDGRRHRFWNLAIAGRSDLDFVALLLLSHFLAIEGATKAALAEHLVDP